jgi:geranylgeranyl diphosphate synthase type II
LSTKPNDWIKVYQKKIDGHLKTIIQKTSWDPLLKKASLYSLDTGKRLRPILALLLQKPSKKINDSVLDAVCALELVHNYSLIHDDLPCMDDDDYRRGKLSLHKAFPEWVALLTADAFLTKAFELLASVNFPSSQKIHLIQILSHYSGGEYLISGQILDLNSANISLDQQMAIKINMQKTSSLLMASLLMGSVIARYSSSLQPLMIEMGKNMGIYYQILDDLQDYKSKRNAHKKHISLNLVKIIGKGSTLKLANFYKNKITQNLEILKKHIPLININLLSSLIEGWK